MFRLKIIFLTAVLSGIALTAFSIFFYGIISRDSLRKIDLEILTFGEGQLFSFHGKEHWEEMGRTIAFVYARKGLDEIIFRVTTSRGVALYSTPNWPTNLTIDSFPGFDFEMEPPPKFDRHNPPPSPEALLVQAPLKRPFLKTIHLNGTDWRVGIMGNKFFTLMFGRSLHDREAEMNKYKMIFSVSILVTLVLLSLGSWFIVERSLRPVKLIAETAKSITALGLHRRIPDSGEASEFHALIHVINDMLDRLESGFSQAARFSADAAHELQTPLTILQGVLDNAVRNAEDGSEEQQRSSNLLEEIQRLKIVVKKLLILSLADAGQLTIVPETIRFSEMVEVIVEDMFIIAGHLDITHRIQKGIRISGDPVLLRQVIQNLATNAVKHNAGQGTIHFKLTAEKASVFFEVTNSANPIQEDEQAHLFDRFYRIDKSRSNKAPGAGLGLSLAKEITRAHKGRLTMTSDTVNGLVTFLLELPVVSS